VIFASASTGVAGLTTIVIVGTWLDDRLGVSTGGVGLVAMAFGAAELSSSISSAVFADRIGKVRSTRAMLFLVLVGLTIMTQAGTSLVIGVLGLLCFFVGFEFSIVTSFGIISEAMPQARGRALAAGNAVGTMTRGASAIASGRLYDEFGINGPVTLSAIGAVVAITLLTVHQRSAAGHEMVQKEHRHYSGS
jgi:predicted MFS family arabinose efflux permease